MFAFAMLQPNAPNSRTKRVGTIVEGSNHRACFGAAIVEKQSPGGPGLCIAKPKSGLVQARPCRRRLTNSPPRIAAPSSVNVPGSGTSPPPLVLLELVLLELLLLELLLLELCCC